MKRSTKYFVTQTLVVMMFLTSCGQQTYEYQNSIPENNSNYTEISMSIAPTTDSLILSESKLLETVDTINNDSSIVQIGEIIHLGGYEWRVLDTQASMTLVISEKMLTQQRFDSNSEAQIWENSTIRNYLNGEFFDKTFTDIEKSMIVETSIKNPANPWFPDVDRPDTKDKVFLLSVEEVVKYFGDSGQIMNRPEGRGVIVDEYNDTRIGIKLNPDDLGDEYGWWLRTTGARTYNDRFATAVNRNGEIDIAGFDINIAAGIRPAMWVNIH